ncbi:MAG: hypothetical protein ACF788_09390, partial [Novipirellula sp. JB048]
GVADERVTRMLEELDARRDEILEIPFVRLPAQQLEAYVAVREASEVGRVFKIANTIHDKIDAVVVLAADAHAAGPVALMDACCDPYHNELTRAGRGSKPRMYFAGNHLDNDSIATLLHRLRRGGYGETAPERRWALVVIDPCGQTREASVILPHFIDALQASLATGAQPPGESIGDYLLPITVRSGPLRDFAVEAGCAEIYDLREDIEESHSIFTAAGLLPAALLGLDCMKLLEGAVVMNEHFKSAAAADNMVLQYVATNRLLAKRCRVLSVWTEALESVARWYTQLLNEPLGSTVISKPSDLVRQTALPPCSVSSDRGDRGDRGESRSVVHHWATSAWRMDPLSCAPIASEPTPAEPASAETRPAIRGGESDSSLTIAQRLGELVGAAHDAVHRAGYPTTRFELPHIDTFTLGQLFQMLMIANAIETRCRKAGSSGV